jgi:hypothetical protein
LSRGIANRSGEVMGDGLKDGAEGLFEGFHLGGCPVAIVEV